VEERDETVREFLRRRGSPDPVVDRGLPGLVEAWGKTANELARGYSLGLDDYLNDLDARQLIEEALEFASLTEIEKVRPRLDAADALAREQLEPLARCVWGEGSARYHGWTPERNWWYFAAPRNAGEALVSELKQHGG
jgi:hypothetical protein